MTHLYKFFFLESISRTNQWSTISVLCHTSKIPKVRVNYEIGSTGELDIIHVMASRQAGVLFCSGGDAVKMG
jgi:hypothetical protein